MSLPRPRVIARLTAVAVLLAGLITVLGAPPAGAANLENHRPVSYNMQGGQGGDVTPKWSNDIPQLLRNHDVLALQEAGPLPALDPNGLFHYQDTTTINGYNIYHYLRNFGTENNVILRHVYFMQTDPNGNRVNLAMVTEAEPDALWVTTPPFNGARPSFGVQLGNTAFHDVHGASGNGNDMPGIIRAVAAGAQAAGIDYAVLGDFNRHPDTLNGRLPAGAHVYRPGATTQVSGGELDYMVADRDVPLFTGHVMPGISADHLPVEFGVINLRAAAGYAMGSYSAYGDQERIVDIFNDETANGTHVIVYDNHNGGNQHFDFVPTADGHYNLRNQETGKCLDLNRGTGARAGDYVNEWDCQGQTTQNWDVEYWTSDPGAAAISNTYTGWCLDVFRGGTGNGTWTDVWPCTGAQNQRWTLEYLGSELATASTLAQPARTPALKSAAGAGEAHPVSPGRAVSRQGG